MDHSSPPRQDGWLDPLVAAADGMIVSTLILGGARSGKSALAERLATASRLDRVYVATAQALDDEMRQRITRHRTERGAGWTTVEAPLALAETLEREAGASRVLLIDCLTLWLSNIMLADRDVDRDIDGLIDTLRHMASPLIVVSNEIGLGVVPENALARRFRDAQGRLNQRAARILPRAVFLAAGLPVLLKGPPLETI
jgi:adenosylcobinamide kinase/adenosylcobinamide-phosphate guanylyltransferase